jgi:hypothetical protein
LFAGGRIADDASFADLGWGEFKLGFDEADDLAAREQAVEKIRTWVDARPDLTWAGLLPSPITGTDGNIEFLALLRKAG